MKRCAKWVARTSSMPPSIKRFLMSSSTTRFGSKYSLRNRGSWEMYVEFEAYRDLGILHLSFLRGCLC